MVLSDTSLMSVLKVNAFPWMKVAIPVAAFAIVIITDFYYLCIHNRDRRA